MPQNPHIREWVKAARGGEEQAWNVLYNQYYPGLYALAIQTCGNFSEAKDIVQDSFIVAWLRLSQLRDASTFGAWVRTILIRNCYQWLNKNRRTSRLDFASMESDHLIDMEIEKKLDNLWIQKRLNTALIELPENLRSALLLRFFSSYRTYQEIALILGVPVGTVRSRLNEAKLRLAEKWQQPLDCGMNILKENEEWNSFYRETYSGIHHSDDCKERFFRHLGKTVQIVLPGRKSNNGSLVFEKMIADDRKAGSYLSPLHVMTSGNISIVEVKHFNSADHPNHCPPASLTLLFRNNSEVNKMNLFL